MGEPPAVARYGVALLAVLLAFLLNALLRTLVQGESPFLLLSAAVLVAAAYGGFGPGAFATLLGAAAGDYLFLSPDRALVPTTAEHGLRTGLFVGQGLAISAIGAWLASARRRAEGALGSLAASEERYRLLVEGAKDYAILMLDLGGRVTSWNEGAERLFGYGEGEIVGEHGSLLFTPEDRRRGADEEELRKARTEGRAENERWHVRKDGSRFWASGFVRPLRGEDGGLRGYAKVARDVTERKEALERARFLAELGQALQPLGDPDEAMKTAARMLGEHLGADRCAYAEAEADEDHFRITGDYARDVPSIVGRFAMSQFGTKALGLMRANEPYVVDDAEEDARVSEADLAAYRQTQIRAVISVPLHKGGRFVAGMAVHQKTPRRWSRQEVGLVETVAERCWESMERARAARGLRESEERYRTLFESIDEGFCLIESLFDEDGRPTDYRFLEVNPAFEEQTGLAGAVGRRMRELVPDIEARWVEIYGNVALTGEPVRFEDRAEAMGRWFDVYAFRVGRPESRRVAVLFKDITAPKEADEALRQSEERYRAVIEQSAEGIYLVDAETLRIREANPAFLRMVGYAPEELEGRELHGLIALPRGEVEEAARLTLRAGRRAVGERRYRRKDGTLVDVEVGASAISYGGRRVICAVVRDTTERRRAEEGLREAREAERGRLARDIHDGPLQDLSYAAQAIDIVASVPPEEVPPGMLGSALGALRRSVHGLRGAVNDLRRDERDRPFSELVGALVDGARAMAPDQNVRLEVGEGFPRAPLGRRGDQVLAVIREALTNARRHSGAKNVRVGLGAEGGDLIAEVADDGRGLGPGASPGVGLSSMRERAAALGGRLEVESEVGGGTTVRLRVPGPEAYPVTSG